MSYRPIWIKFGTGSDHNNSPSNCEFVEHIHTLLTDVNESLSLLSIFIVGFYPKIGLSNQTEIKQKICYYNVTRPCYDGTL